MSNLINKLIALGNLPEQIAQQSSYIEQQMALICKQTEQLTHMGEMLKEQGRELTQLGMVLKHLDGQWGRGFSVGQMEMLSSRLRRNFLPNDNAVVQKHIMAVWRTDSESVISYKDLLESAFRVFSQNDEDGVLLRIFSHIGQTNKFVIEIGSNCSDSDIGMPENLSTNLIVNHGWHGAIFEIDPIECARIRHFFARDFATKHFHDFIIGQPSYFSPLIVEKAISPENIDQVLLSAHKETEPDLMAIDIDGGDYAVMSSLSVYRPRVLVVEFEKRFRDRHSVVQFDRTAFSKRWPQSGAASLPAWAALLVGRGYTLCAIGTSGFNAFFVRTDIAIGKFSPITPTEAFDVHPILSKVPESFWISPDESWSLV